MRTLGGLSQACPSTGCLPQPAAWGHGHGGGGVSVSSWPGATLELPVLARHPWAAWIGSIQPASPMPLDKEQSWGGGSGRAQSWKIPEEEGGERKKKGTHCPGSLHSQAGSLDPSFIPRKKWAPCLHLLPPPWVPSPQHKPSLATHTAETVPYLCGLQGASRLVG